LDGAELMLTRIYALLLAQFLTALSDNAVLFAAIAMILQMDASPVWYVPVLQASFLLAFVVLAPWVGSYADRRAKPRVLMIGNIIKVMGVALIMIGVEPLAAYALIGFGAAVYSPAKYGILPELVPQHQLLKANSWIEATTISAIILGAILGGRLADFSINIALWVVLGCYLLSLLMTFLIPRLKPRSLDAQPAFLDFIKIMRSFMVVPRVRFAIFSASLFWGASAVLRVLLVAWVPAVLMARSAGDIAELTLFLAIGVIMGAVIVPKLIKLDTLGRTRYPAYAMGCLILIFSMVENFWSAGFVLFLIGIAGGMFIVPINTVLQQIGHSTIGSGHAIAVQNFFENLAMLLTVGLYSIAAAAGVSSVTALFTLGVVFVAISFGIFHCLRTNKNSSAISAD